MKTGVGWLGLPKSLPKPLPKPFGSISPGCREDTTVRVKTHMCASNDRDMKLIRVILLPILLLRQTLVSFRDWEDFTILLGTSDPNSAERVRVDFTTDAIETIKLGLYNN